MKQVCNILHSVLRHNILNSSERVFQREQIPMKKIRLRFHCHTFHLFFLFLLGFSNSMVAQVVNEDIPGTVKNFNQTTASSPISSTLRTTVVGLQQIYSSTGHYTLSTDGIGSNNTSMNIRVNKPNTQAIVQKAILLSTVTPYNTISDGCVTIAGQQVNWDGSASVSFFTSYWADVTSVVADEINAFPAGISTLPLTECNTGIIDGEALLVVFSDPLATEKTIIIMGGAMNPSGDNFSVTLAQAIDPSQEGALLDMGLGIGFSFQLFGGNQTSEVTVNGQRITSSAGGEDDGQSGNGALITVGGIGDDHDNPVDPFAAPTNIRSDDELYNILPFITNTTTSLVITTINPSLDDNIFLAYFVTSGAAVVGEGILLSQTSSSGEVGSTHTVKAAVVNSTGEPVIDRELTFTITSGPNAGNTFSTNTDANGEAFYTYTGTGGVGTDNIQACFTNSQNQLDCSNTLTFEWTQTSCNITVLTKKFYDLNTDGIDNDGIPVQGWTISLSGTDQNTNPVGPINQATNAAGTTSFTGIVLGDYTVSEGNQTGWVNTTPTSVNLNLTACTNPAEIKFGNVCIGAGTTVAGTFGVGYWTNKNGQSLITGAYLCELNALCLRNANGSDFDPVAGCPTPSNAQVNNGKNALKTWLQSATATNMSYMLSAQLAAMKLNVLKGYVNSSRLIYAPGTVSANAAGFATVSAIMTEANKMLCANPVISSGNSLLAAAEALKNALDRANNNLNFVQAQPCGIVQSAVTRSEQQPEQLIQSEKLNLKAYPNPSRSYFVLSVPASQDQPVSMRVTDAVGKMIEIRKVLFTEQVIRIGEQYKPGVYFVQVIQGNKQQTIKIIKQ